MSAAWIFMSIGDAGGSDNWVPLDSLIRAADANNHSIPTVDELEDSISKLAAAGLVEVHGSRTHLTKEGAGVYREATKEPVGHILRMLNLSREWESRGYPAAAAKSWKLDAQDYQQAWSDYRAWFQEEYARLKARDEQTDE